MIKMIGIKQYVVGKQDSQKCEFDMRFGWIFYIATALKMCGMYFNFGGRFKSAYELLNLRVLQFSTVYI